MTISSTVDKMTYVGNGSQVTFPYTFIVFSSADLRVTKYTIASGVSTVLTLNTDYTVTGVGLAAGGDVVLTTAPSSAYEVIIERVPDFLQTLDLIENDPFPAETVEDTLDKIATFCQRLKSLMDRTPYMDASNSSAPGFPTPVAGKYLYAYSASVLQWAAITATNYAGTFASGNDADKSAAPAIKDIYVALDTGKIYYCYTAGTWTEYTETDGAKKYLEVVTISQESYSADIFQMVYGVTANTWGYQSFTAPRDMYVSQVSLYRDSHTPTAATRLSIAFETDNAGAPSGVLVAAEVAGITLTANGGWKDLALGTTIKFTAGTKYWLRVRVTAPADGGWNFGIAATQVIPNEHFIWGGETYDRAIAFKLTSGTITAGKVVKVGSDYLLAEAQADSEANSKGVIGVVESITTVSYYSFMKVGLPGSIVTSLTGLTPGSLYYLSPSTAGAVTATKPTTIGQYVKPMAVALTEATAVIINQVGIVVPAAAVTIPTYLSWENSMVFNDNEPVTE